MNDRKYHKIIALFAAVLALSFTAASSSSAGAALPRSYDLREKGWLSPVKQQHPDGKPFGVCWSMSMTAAVESSLISQGLMKSKESLSVWYQVYYTFNDEGAGLPAFEAGSEEYYNDGGTVFQAAALYARGTGPLFESRAPYPEHIAAVYKPEARLRDFKVTGVYFLSDDLHLLKNSDTVNIYNDGEARVKLLKETILDCGALAVDIFHPDEDPEEGVPDDLQLISSSDAYFTGIFGQGRPNHSVLIVGWDDGFSRDKFGGVYSPDMKPRTDGAWVVRNSWGTEYGDGGYYYVSYEEASLCNGSAFIAGRAAGNENVYQYDPLGLVGFIGDGRYIEPEEESGPDPEEEPVPEEEEPEEEEGEDGAAGRVRASSDYGMESSAFANIFTAKRDESLTAVAFYTPLPNAECEVSIYTGCAGSPVSGARRLTFARSLKYAGYNTLVMPSPVSVAAGENFSVTVKLTTPGRVVRRIPVEYPSRDEETDKSTCEKGRCWKSSNGTEWTDLCSPTWDEGNVCLKAFAVPRNEAGSGCRAGWPALAVLAALPALGKRRQRSPRVSRG